MITKKCLAIADTHYMPIDLFDETIPNINIYDTVFTLGDVHINMLNHINNIIEDPNKFIGILGNHDPKNKYLSENLFINCHLKPMKLWNSINIMGFQGSLRYKEPSVYPVYTDKESIDLLSKFYKSEIDILLSHDSIKDTKTYKDCKHCDMLGVNKFLKKNKNILFNIHGHYHENIHRKITTGIFKKRNINIYGIYLISEMNVYIDESNNRLINIDIKNILEEW